MNNSTTIREQANALIEQLVLDLMPQAPAIDSDIRKQVIRGIVAFVVAECRLMPTFLRIPFFASLFVFNWLAILRFGRPYSRLKTPDKRRFVAICQNSSVSFLRDIVRALRTLTFLGYMDHPKVVNQLELTPGDDA